MPLPSTLQLSVELTNVFGLRELMNSATLAVMNYARELRRSGSDIVVEEDLANVFGRGRIVPALEAEFKKEVLKDVRITPLYPSSDIALCAGPGPTVARALKTDNQRYLAVVIQLSMLAWGQDRNILVSCLVDCMIKRAEEKVPGATTDSGFEAILGTLACCSSQGHFAWDTYYRTIERNLRRLVPHLSPNQCAALLEVPREILLGAMDYFYIVQRLPENRKVKVRTWRGVSTLVLWAHFVLGLSVEVYLVGESGVDYSLGCLFEEAGSSAWDAQVVIEWDAEEREDRTTTRLDLNTIMLLDQDLDVVLKLPPIESIGAEIATEERHVLRGAGADFLRRWYNTYISVRDADPICLTTIEMVMAFALLGSRRLRRKFQFTGFSADSFLDYKLERWRVIRSARILFDGFNFEEDQIDEYQTQLQDEKVGYMPLPRCLQLYAQKIREDENCVSALIVLLTELVLTCAHVVEIRECAEVPIAFDLESVFRKSSLKLSTHATIPILLLEDDFLRLWACLLCGKKRAESSLAGIILISDFGWSVYLDSLGDVDPVDVQPELIHIKSGVPTSNRTQERKSQIRCSDGQMPRRLPTRRRFRDRTYVPCCIHKVIDRVKYYISRRDEFIFAVRLKVQGESVSEEINTEVAYLDCRALHQGLWTLLQTSPCGHEKADPRTNMERRHGMEVAPVAGWCHGLRLDFTARIWVLLVKGDRGARILSVIHPVAQKVDERSRMIRTEDCCEDCALDQVIMRPNKWVLIL